MISRSGQEDLAPVYRICAADSDVIVRRSDGRSADTGGLEDAGI